MPLVSDIMRHRTRCKQKPGVGHPLLSPVPECIVVMQHGTGHMLPPWSCRQAQPTTSNHGTRVLTDHLACITLNHQHYDQNQTPDPLSFLMHPLTPQFQLLPLCC